VDEGLVRQYRLDENVRRYIEETNVLIRDISLIQCHRAIAKAMGYRDDKPYSSATCNNERDHTTSHHINHLVVLIKKYYRTIHFIEDELLNPHFTKTMPLPGQLACLRERRQQATKL